MTTAIKPWYKQTKVGIIPNDWDCVQFWGIFESITNWTSATQVNFGIWRKPVTRIETISQWIINYDKVWYIECFEWLEKLKLRKWDILFSNINSVKHIWKIAYFDSDKELYHWMNLLLMRWNEKVKDKYLYYLLIFNKRLFEINCKQSVNQASISQSDIKKLYITLPTNPAEQSKIADIISSVDELIEKTDKVIEKQKKLKEGVLSKLMKEWIGHTEFKDSKLGRIPKDWEVVRLKDLFQRITTKNKGRSQNVLTISAQQWLIKQEHFFNKTVASSNLDGYYLLEKWDFAYNKSYSNWYPYWVVRKLEKYDEWVVSSLYICFRLTDMNCISSFYNQYFDTRMEKSVILISQEWARNHWLLNIAVWDFFDADIIKPPKEEQQRISNKLVGILKSTMKYV